jgi:hypothetical protein
MSGGSDDGGETGVVFKVKERRSLNGVCLRGISPAPERYASPFSGLGEVHKRYQHARHKSLLHALNTLRANIVVLRTG